MYENTSKIANFNKVLQVNFRKFLQISQILAQTLKKLESGCFDQPNYRICFFVWIGLHLLKMPYLKSSNFFLHFFFNAPKSSSFIHPTSSNIVKGMFNPYWLPSIKFISISISISVKNFFADHKATSYSFPLVT